jgi:hypothetical protein
MINGSVDLDQALARLNEIMDIVREEKQSIDYTHANAPLTGRTIAENAPLEEILEIARNVKESTVQSKENIEKILIIMHISSKILEHYSKLADIGDVWESIIEKSVDNLRHYQ